MEEYMDYLAKYREWLANPALCAEMGSCAGTNAKGLPKRQTSSNLTGISPTVNIFRLATASQAGGCSAPRMRTHFCSLCSQRWVLRAGAKKAESEV